MTTKQQHNESEFVQHLPCPSCHSSDGNALYSDGHTFCFSCGSTTPAKANGETQAATATAKASRTALIDGDYRELTKRGISLDTCKKWGYQVGVMSEQPVQLANYFDPNGRYVVAQKIRTASKDFKFLGDTKAAGLYGQWLWRDGGKMLVITEGEIDALSVSQVQNNKWPVVSVPNGAQGARKALQKQLEWLEKFDSVILMFDQDTPGHEAAEECASLFTPGKCKVAKLPLKDANAMLQANRGAEIIDAIWGAKVFRPDGIVTLADVTADMLKPIEIGLPWPWPGLTKATYGRRYGEVYALGAGTGVGKTDVFTQIIAHTITELKEPCGVVYLEQPVVETGRRIAGKVVGKKFHVPDGSWTPAELGDALSQLDAGGQLFLYNHFGSSEWELVKSRIRFMVVSLGAKHIFLDHLTALAAAEEDERKALEAIMSEISGMAQELNFCFYFISHLATPEGKPHEEGGRVMIRHFKGSRAIGFWSHYMLGLERNQQDEDLSKRHLTVLRVLKDRYTGQATGQQFHLSYDQETGLLAEVDAMGDSPFKAIDNHEEF